MTILEDCARVAAAAVAEAAQHLRAVAGGPQRVEYKGAVDLVTETDRALEAMIGARLRAAFADHRIIGEEAAAGGVPSRPAADEWTWYLDPLDGTTNFAHGHPHFAVSLGLARGAELQCAVVADPLRDETFAAVRGRGATLNGKPIRVSPVGGLDAALLASGTPYDRRERAGLYLGAIQAAMMRVQGIRRGGSAALDLCWVACGRVDAYWEWRLGPWDVAAGALIVREAGGQVSDLGGGAHDVHGQETLASNGLLHAAMVELLAPFAAADRGARG
ncbi:MAG: inositol monophosphatase family protein [bacterium]